jgi:hypothetical protein
LNLAEYEVPASLAFVVEVSTPPFCPTAVIVLPWGVWDVFLLLLRGVIESVFRTVSTPGRAERYPVSSSSNRFFTLVVNCRLSRGCRSWSLVLLG